MDIYSVIRIFISSLVVILIIDYMFSYNRKYNFYITESINLFYLIAINVIYYFTLGRLEVLANHSYLFFTFFISYLGIMFIIYDNKTFNKPLIFFLTLLFSYSIYSFSFHFAYPLKKYDVNLSIVSLIITIFMFLVSIIFVIDSLFRRIKNSTIHYPNKTSAIIISSSILWGIFLSVFSFTDKVLSLAENALIVVAFYIPFYIQYVFTFLFLLSQHNALEWEELASVDYLTGLKNRKALVSQCENKILCNDKFTLFYLDLDHFKSINDFYGHLVGDDYLIKFSEMIKKIVSDKGTCYRLAGDEFVIIYDKDNYDDIAGIIMESKPVLPINVNYYGVSLGYVNYPFHANTVDELLKAADKKLYERKNIRK